MSTLFGNDEEGRAAYKALKKQTWEKLRVLRKAISEINMSHHNKKKKKKPKKGY